MRRTKKKIRRKASSAREGAKTEEPKSQSYRIEHGMEDTGRFSLLPLRATGPAPTNLLPWRVVQTRSSAPSKKVQESCLGPGANEDIGEQLV